MIYLYLSNFNNNYKHTGSIHLSYDFSSIDAHKNLSARAEYERYTDVRVTRDERAAKQIAKPWYFVT